MAKRARRAPALDATVRLEPLIAAVVVGNGPPVGAERGGPQNHGRRSFSIRRVLTVLC